MPGNLALENGTLPSNSIQTGSFVKPRDSFKLTGPSIRENVLCHMK